MIEESKEQISGHSKQPTKPLIRLRVEYACEKEMFCVPRFCFRFCDDVANVHDMILMKRERRTVLKKEEDGSVIDEEVMESLDVMEVSD